mgnify:CR=1 FL=1
MDGKSVMRSLSSMGGTHRRSRTYSLVDGATQGLHKGSLVETCIANPINPRRRRGIVRPQDSTLRVYPSLWLLAISRLCTPVWRRRPLNPVRRAHVLFLSFFFLRNYLFFIILCFCLFVCLFIYRYCSPLLDCRRSRRGGVARGRGQGRRWEKGQEAAACTQP